MQVHMSASRKITIGAMVTALSLVFLYVASITPAWDYACYFLCSVFIYALTAEKAYVTACISFIATSVIAFLLVSNRMSVLYYVFLLGHYGIFMTLIDQHVKKRVLAAIIKLLYCDAFVVLGGFIAVSVLDLWNLTMPFNLPVWAVIVLAQIVFVAYDLLYHVCTRIYESRIRRLLMPRR